jgi:hypothetical protein
MTANLEGVPLPPLTYQQIGAGQVGAVLMLLGNTVWRQFYGTDAIEHNRLVPWQVLLLIRHALMKFATELVINEKMTKNMDSILGDARQTAKTQGYEPY